MAEVTIVVAMASIGVAAAECARRAMVGRRMERAVHRWEPGAMVVVPDRSASLRRRGHDERVPVVERRAS